MNRYIICCLALLCLGISQSIGQASSSSIRIFDRDIPDKADKEFQFLAYFFNQGVAGNYFPTNDLLKGQVVGRLFGPNSTGVSDSLETRYFEQRIIPFFIYKPHLLDGRVILRASFEIDWTWGDVAYSNGGNFGAGFAADGVNLQTQNLELEFLPGKGYAINLGLQRLFDTPYNPYRTLFNRMTESSFRLAYWGSDAVGISVRRDQDFYKWKAGFYQLYENSIQENDDVQLFELNSEFRLGHKIKVGAAAYYLKDRANGEGGPSVLSQGLNSSLANYNGVYRFPLGRNPYQADVFWLGGFFGYNQTYLQDRWFATGFANLNLGSVRAQKSDTTDYEKVSSILGLGANLRVGYRHGQTENDLITLDAWYTTADDADPERYTGVITGNTWGAPGAIFISSGSYILFPHGNVVNRFVSAVPDISNNGYGLIGGTLNIMDDVIPNKVNLKAGLAYAQANADVPGGGRVLGWEVNGRISYQPAVLMNIEIHGAYMGLGNFFDSPILNGGSATRPVNPWTVFLVYKWLMF